MTVAAAPAPVVPAAVVPAAAAVVPAPAIVPAPAAPAAAAAVPATPVPAAAAVPAAAGEVKPAAAVPVGDQPAAVVPAATVVPEKYTLKIPDGATDWLDQADVTALEATARTKGLSNEQAQAILTEQADALAAQSAAFRTATEADATYGGDKLAETQRLSRSVLDRVRPAGTPHGDALRKVLAKTGYGNHVEVISFLADLGKMMAEDSPHPGSSSAGAARDAASVLYGGEAKKSS